MKDLITPLIRTAFALAMACGFCVRGPAAEATDLAPPVIARSAPDPQPIRYGYSVVHAWPHDPGAFTQGLVFFEGGLLESTGLNGESTLRAVELATGQVKKTIALPAEYFAEGLAVIGTHAYQITWKNHQGFIYDTRTLRREGEFTYEGEGWGLTSDGQSLLLSDGTDQIRFIDPATFQVKRTIHVSVVGRPVARINELEWIKGEIFANVWMTNAIIRIDPATGIVRGVIDCANLLPPEQRQPNTDVLNGIAYDPAGDRLFVTGKRWPKIFEVRLIEQTNPR